MVDTFPQNLGVGLRYLFRENAFTGRLTDEPDAHATIEKTPAKTRLHSNTAFIFCVLSKSLWVNFVPDYAKYRLYFKMPGMFTKIV